MTPTPRVDSRHLRAAEQTFSLKGETARMRTLAKIVINAAAIWVASALLNGITLDEGLASTSSKLLTALAVGALFGVVNALVRPIAKLLSLPFLVLTLWLFIFVINAAMLMLTSWIAGRMGLSFHIDAFFPTAVLGSLIVSFVSWMLGLFFDPDDDPHGYGYHDRPTMSRY